MKERLLILIGCLLAHLLAACGGGAAPAATGTATLAATTVGAVTTNQSPNVAPTSLPASVVPPTPTGEPPVNPVEFVWSITGEPNPLDSPADLAFDLQDNLYVVDAGNNRIQVFDPDGNFVRMWGKPGSGEGEFNFHRSERDQLGGIEVDLEGNVYVADNVNRRIQKFDSNGTFLLQWGSRGRGDGQFISPIGVAVDPQGNVYVIDDARDDIQKFDSSGRYLSTFGGHGTDDGQLNYTGNLAIDSQGNVYVADFDNHRIQKFDSQGNFLAKWGSLGTGPGQFIQPVAVAVNPQGQVFTVEFAGNVAAARRVQMFDGVGTFLGTWGGPGLEDGQFYYPAAIAIDSQGAIYVSDESGRIQKFRLATATPSGEPTAEPAASPVDFVWQVTGDDTPLYWPSGLALDLDGNLFVADTRNHRILTYSPDGQLLRTLGGEGSGAGEFNFVWGDPNHNLPAAGLAVDADGNLYVTDMGNVRIQKFDRDGNFVAKWGSQGAGDGQFARPFDLAVDAQGNVYVIDDRSNPRGRIQKFDGDGNFLAWFGEGLFADPGGIALDAQGNIYVTDVERGALLKLDNNGELLTTWGSQGTGDGEFRGPLGVTVDGQGNIYVVDSQNGRIQKLDSEGRYLFQWGTRGSEAGQFVEPCCIRVDSQGDIYVSDQFNNRVQKFQQSQASLRPSGLHAPPRRRRTVPDAGLVFRPLHLRDQPAVRRHRLGRSDG